MIFAQTHFVKPIKDITTLVVVMSFLLLSCGENKSSIEKISTSRLEKPQLNADSVTTLISDSGITRFKIVAKKWLIFDKAKEPYWHFPKGIYFEKFDIQYRVDAKMKSNKAVYWPVKKIWRFDGDVSARNLNGEVFETQQLYWDNNQEKFYSNKEITIWQYDKKIVGVGFESNSSLTRYTIKSPKGIFPINQEEN